VFAAAVILPPDLEHELLNDSKVLEPADREMMAEFIKEQAISYGVSFCSPGKIDQINILNASFSAMHAAVRKLQTRPAHLLIDGNRFNPLKGYDFTTIIKGDGKIGSIAAASILAKTARDKYMKRKHRDYPQYHWITNKGYPTMAHRQAILDHGLTPLHRMSFRQYPLPEQLVLFDT